MMIKQATLWEQRILFEISTVMRNKQVHGEQATLFGTIKIMWIKQDYVKHTNLCGTSKIIRNKEIYAELLLFIKRRIGETRRIMCNEQCCEK